MTMPWRCFVCRSDQHNCGHREGELVEWARPMAKIVPRRKPDPVIVEPISLGRSLPHVRCGFPSGGRQLAR